MNIWQAGVLGLIQGLTEFLPVSSSGHLVLFQRLLGISIPGITFEITVHLGTLVAVLLYYYEDIFYVIGRVLSGFHDVLKYKNLKSYPWEEPGSRLGILVVIGTIPAALAGVLGETLLSTLFDSPIVASIGLIMTGFILWFFGNPRHGATSEVSFVAAVGVGISQAIAVVPGISRSGSTISSGLAFGLERRLAAKFSFMLSIPVILGAALVDIPKFFLSSSDITFPNLIVGFVVAAISGYAAIHYVISALNKGSFKGFAYYVWIVGSTSLILYFIR